MRTLIPFLCFVVSCVHAQVLPAASGSPAKDYQITERGPDHRVWSRVERGTDPSGREVDRVVSYTELATGLHYWDEGWKDSRAEFEITPEGYALARYGRHRVRISPILNDAEGAVYVETEGCRMRSTVLGLAIRDRVKGGSVVLAQIREGVEGRLVAPGEILFENCSDELKFDLRYVYEIGGFHQDLIFRESINPAWVREQGFDPETSTVEIWTEFFESPEPTIVPTVMASVQDPVQRSLMVQPDLIEEHLDFGAVAFPVGRAYLQKTDASPEDSANVAKRWLNIDGRTFLVESMTLSDFRPLTASLPKWNPEGSRTKTLLSGYQPPKPKLSHSQGKTMLTASLGRSAAIPGVVWDYPLTISGNLTNFVFTNGATYFVSGQVSLYGSNTLMGGSVLKFAKGVNAYVRLYGPLACATAMHRMAIFTAKDDDTVGEIVSGSSGTPSGEYAYACLYWSSPTTPLDLHDLRISHATYGIFLSPSGSCTNIIRDSQFYRNRTPLCIDGSSTAWLQNLLLYQSTYRAVYGLNATLRCEHLTVHQANMIFSNGSASVTNSLFISITNWSTAFTSVNNRTNTTADGVLETVGAGAHYLVESSNYRGAGTTNVSQRVLQSIRQRTTSAPLLLSNIVSGDVELYPRAQRGTGTPNIGYHYPPIDYLTMGFQVTNGTLRVQNS